MKKITFLLIAVFMCSMLYGQITVNSIGNVGIGTNASTGYKFQVDGFSRFTPGWVGLMVGWSSPSYCPAIYTDYNNYMWLGTPSRWANHLWVYTVDYQDLRKNSDFRLKENIKPCLSVLPKIKQMEIYTFNYNDTYFKDFTPEQKQKAQKKEFGVIAQELEKIFPELVYKPDELSEYYGVDYVSMIPILVQAIKEQQTQIENLQTMLSKQETEMILLKEQSGTNYQNNPANSSSQNMQTGENLIQNKESKLFQNTPNPFSVNTEIKFEILENSTSARLLIHDMQGAEIKSYFITTKGIGSLIIQGSELQAGMYMYTLLVNNTIVDSKRMVLTK